MLSKALTKTLILITRDRLVRADLKSGRSPEIKGLWQRQKPDTNDPATLVETAIRLGKKKPGKVVVLSSDLWIQTLRMPVDATRGLSDQELSRALAFEAEPLSGITAFDSQVSYVAMPSDGQHREFWIVQSPSSHLEQIDDAVSEAGGVFVGLGHPAGMSRPCIAPGSGERWQRVELWPGAIVCVRGASGNPPRAHVINADPALRTWQAAVEQWRVGEERAPRTEWLVPDVGVQVPAEPGDVFSLVPEESLRLWLADWAAVLFGPSPSVPLARPAPRPMSKQRRLAIAAGLALMAGALCYGHYTLAEERIAGLNAQILGIKNQVGKLDALKKQGADLAKKRDKSRDELQTLSKKVDDCTATLSAHRSRWQKLLLLLAENRPQHLMVKKIDGRDERINISGLCLGPHPANALASDLESRLRELGWRVQPARQEAGKALASGDPWKFELSLKDIAPTGDSAQAAEPRRRGAPREPAEPVDKVVSFPEAIGEKRP